MLYRCLLAALCAMLFSVGFSGLLLPLLKKLKAGQQILCYVKLHSNKSGTPTMGGLAFISAFLLVGILMTRGSNSLAVTALTVTVCYAVIGFTDDFIKVRFRRNEGLTAKQKLFLQIAVAVITAIAAYRNRLVGSSIIIPFSDSELELGIWFIPFAVIAFLGLTNGVNLTDGLDGLAASVTATVTAFAAVFTVIAAKGYSDLSISEEYGNLALVAAIMCGCLVGFLPFNAFPARVFMGDTGSMALGALVACVGIYSRSALVMAVFGVMYVVSVVSVIIQVCVYKLKRKRVFLMTPFHHHLQMKGMSEPQIGTLYTLLTLAVGVAVTLWALQQSI